MHQNQQAQDIETGSITKVSSKKSITYGNVLNTIYKLAVAGASVFGLAYLASGWFKRSLSKSSTNDNSASLALRRGAVGLVPSDNTKRSGTVPLSFANDIFDENSKRASLSSRWVSKQSEKKVNFPKLNIVENTNLEKNIAQHTRRKLMASEPPKLIKNELPIAKGESVIITQEYLNANKTGCTATDLKFETSAIKNGQFELVSNGFATTSFTLQDIIDGKIGFRSDGSIVTPTYKIRVIDKNDQTASDFELASVNFFEKKLTRIGEESQINKAYPTYAPYSNYAIIPSSNNKTLVAHAAKVGTDYQIRGQFLHPINGTFCGSGFAMVSYSKKLYLSNRALALFSDGKIIMTFEGEGVGGSSKIFYKIFHKPNDDNCSPLLQYNSKIAVTTTDKNNTQFNYFPAVVILSNNQTEPNEEFIIGWFRASTSSIWEENVFAKKSSKDSDPIADEIQLTYHNSATGWGAPIYNFDNEKILFAYTTYMNETERAVAQITGSDKNITTLKPEFHLKENPNKQEIQLLRAAYEVNSEEIMVIMDVCIVVLLIMKETFLYKRYLIMEHMTLLYKLLITR